MTSMLTAQEKIELGWKLVCEGVHESCPDRFQRAHVLDRSEALMGQAHRGEIFDAALHCLKQNGYVSGGGMGGWWNRHGN